MESAKNDEKPWMFMDDCDALSPDDWMCENSGLAEAIIDSFTREGAKKAIFSYLEKNCEADEAVEKVELCEDCVKIWYAPSGLEDYRGVVVRDQDIPGFEEAAARRLKAILEPYLKVHGSEE